MMGVGSAVDLVAQGALQRQGKNIPGTGRSGVGAALRRELVCCEAGEGGSAQGALGPDGGRPVGAAVSLSLV